MRRFHRDRDGSPAEFGGRPWHVRFAGKERTSVAAYEKSAKGQKWIFEAMPERKITAGRAAGALHVGGNALAKNGSHDHLAKRQREAEMEEWLRIGANIASILTAVIAAAASSVYWMHKRSRRTRLESTKRKISHRGFFCYPSHGRSRDDRGGYICGKLRKPPRCSRHPQRPGHKFRCRSFVSISGNVGG